MSSLLGELQDQFGQLPYHATQRSVGETSELVRIRDAPSRVWQDMVELEELRRLLTKWLKYDTSVCNPPCEGCRCLLLTGAQATCLRELHNGGRLAGLLRPGAGKTLVSFLCATILKAKKPVLVIPAAQVKKTHIAFTELARHWRLSPIKIETYERLGHPNQVHWLGNYQPDLIVADEAHKLGDSGTKVAKRMSRYIKVQSNCTFVMLTGSPGGRSIKRYWHTMRWALRDNAPLPKDPMEMQAWSSALDEKIPPEARYEPGALLTLAPAEGPDDLARARAAYGKRLTSTVGVVSTLEETPSVGLAIRAIVPELSAEVTDAILTMRETWQTPGGQDFTLALELWRHARTLGVGLWYEWVPPAPEAWKYARRAWYSWVRNKLGEVRKLDSVVHLVENIQQWPEGEAIYRRWKQVEPTFEPNSVPHWVDLSMVDLAADWLSTTQGLVWAEQRAFGEKLAERTGLPFFSSGGMAPDGRFIQTYRGPGIASIPACSEGLNIQHHNRCLVASPPSTGTKWNQMLSRHWRQGQEKDVTCEVILTCRESYQSLAQAVRDGEFDQSSHGQVHPLCFADKDLDCIPELVQNRTNELWAEVGV